MFLDLEMILIFKIGKILVALVMIVKLHLIYYLQFIKHNYIV